jgi:hypothetical protein
MGSTIGEIKRAYLDRYSAGIEAVDPQSYRGIGFAFSNHYTKCNCDFINTISAAFALCNCSAEFSANFGGDLTRDGADSDFFRAALEESRAGHVILATFLFLLSVRSAVDFQVEFVGLNRKKVTLDRYFTESHPSLEEVSEGLMSRFDEVTILTDNRKKTFQMNHKR